jgi:hypothetical protein
MSEWKTATTTTIFAVGDLVRIHGLANKPHYNKMIGVVNSYHENMQRYIIQPSRGPRVLAIKASNLSSDEFVNPTCDKFKAERKYNNVFIWPSPTAGGSKIPIQGFIDCPSAEDMDEQDIYIKNALGWKSVDTLGGIEEEGREKATFLLLFDGLDETSPQNHVAMQIAELLPRYKKETCSRYKGVIRGVAALVYSPTKTTFSSYGMGLDHMNNHVTMEANRNRLFTHQHLHDIIQFHLTDRARKQYSEHNNPMHRVFGGMPMM